MRCAPRRLLMADQSTVDSPGPPWAETPSLGVASLRSRWGEAVAVRGRRCFVRERSTEDAQHSWRTARWRSGPASVG